MTTMVLLLIFSFWIRPNNVRAYIREVRPEHCRDRVQRKATYGVIRLTGNIVSWQPTAHLSLELFYTTQSKTWSWIESWAQFLQLNPAY